ncbi:DNA translocase FtsK [Pelagovum pacificum]|uniref:DNA translocase FtsK n=1 Tax=Pelagovum pacificum TaxID=2588711 RepID=A0A5C5GGR6_9RHOB|nr:DNA translocase FtsK [Pelagovum pacificum]QQA43097.1 DNA translocase FtsK [Pelagovum pacificum]TNY33760.1 DNA translocase FtsK [Pelagovum pacificum]
MAYQTRQRDPLLDSNMQAALEKRGAELIGIVLVLAGLAFFALLWSYTPDDPSWFSATDAPVQNWLGQTGAAIAAPMFMIVGWGGIGIAVLLIAWGLRFTLHRGQERAIGRLIYAPIAVALVSIYASSLELPAGWSHNTGLGGSFGDTAMSIALTIVPVSATIGIKIMSFIFALFLLMLGLFVLGFTRDEVTSGLRFMAVGLVMTYAMILRGLGQGARAAATGTAAMQARRAEARATREVEEPMVEPSLQGSDRVAAVVRAKRASMEQQTAPAPEEAEDNGGFGQVLRDRMEGRQGLLSRVGLRKRPEAEEIDNDEDMTLVEDDKDAGDDRIRSRISDVIKSRVRGPLTAGSSRVEAAVRQRGGPAPLIYKAREETPEVERVEPPVTGTGRVAPSRVRPAAAAPAGDDDQSDIMSRVAAQAIDPRTAPEDEDFDPETMMMPQSELVDGPPPKLDHPKFAAQHVPRSPAPPAPQEPEPPRATQDAARVQQTPRKTVGKSRQAMAEAQPGLRFDESQEAYESPPLNLLTSPDNITRHHLADEALEENARMLENVLDDYGVKGEITSVRPGPVVTMYELEPAPGLKASRVIGLADDIARSMSALSARVSTVPGRSVIGIELPNDNREMVVLREMLASRDFGDGNQRLPLALGKDIGGDPIIANLAKMPHLLIAGTTGSGKSVAINTMILSLLYKLTPEECRLIMIDPKMLELSVYDGIPHLLSPVVTDPKKAVVALKWTVGEMEDRYRKMSKMGVRNIEGYNGRVKDALAKGEMFSRTVQTGFDDETGDPVFETEEFAPEAMPYIVVIVDEMADLMMVAGKEIEACIQRLAQMARASGIHLIMATQRPSVDVITGTIKANFPTRISFQVTSKVDSRTILGEQGAEQLLGQGDMLYMAGGAKITRVHGPFVSDEEVEEIVSHLKQFGPPDYKSGVVEGPDEDKESDIDAVLGLGGSGSGSDTEDALYDTAVHIVAKDRKCSTSYIQRKLAIGYNKAARLVEQMEEQGVVSPANHVGKREVLVPEV